jgi:hypothetical protein
MLELGVISEMHRFPTARFRQRTLRELPLAKADLISERRR